MSLFPLVLIKSMNYRPFILSSMMFVSKRFESGPFQYMGLEIILAVLRKCMKNLFLHRLLRKWETTRSLKRR